MKIQFTAEQVEKLKHVQIPLADGGAFKLEPGNYIFFVNAQKIDFEQFVEVYGYKPEKYDDGVRGYFFAVDGSVDDAFAAFKIEKEKP